MFLCLDCCDLVDDDVLHCNEKFIVRHRRSTESEIQQSLRHQLLDCGHLFLTSDRAGPLLKFVYLVDERPQGVIELIHVFGSVAPRSVADQC